MPQIMKLGRRQHLGPFDPVATRLEWASIEERAGLAGEVERIAR
jgi:hypothetical protein